VPEGYDFDWILKATAMLMVNTFTTQGGKDDVNPATFGTGLFFGTVTSLFNHACVPNCNWSVNEASGKMQLIAVQDVKPSESICIAYTSFDERSERHIRLKGVYGFDCTCEACLLEL